MKHALLLLIVLASASLIACGESERSAASEVTEGTQPAARAEDEGSHQEGKEHAGEGRDEGEGHEDERSNVNLSPDQIRTAGIELARAGPAEIGERVQLYGVIAPNAERVRDVGARFPGIVRSVRKSVGDTAKQGDVLATVESNESLQTYPVLAPLAGVITARNANPGEHTSEKPLFTVADLSTVWVELSLFPRDMARVRVGQSVRVRTAEANLTGDGKVVYVAPLSTGANQTLTARVLLDNSDRKWPPGLYVTAEVIVGRSPTSIAVASTALQTLEERDVVFVQEEAGFAARSVEIGRSDGELTEVRRGLTSGEIYVAKNSFILKAELGKGEVADDD